MTIQEYERQRAEKRFQDGVEADSANALDRATEAFGDAEERFHLLGDVKRVADSCSMLADVYRQKNQLEQAVVSYQRAMKLYQDVLIGP
jgi:tetratricopeptide (TPR) repeat protein